MASSVCSSAAIRRAAVGFCGLVLVVGAWATPAAADVPSRLQLGDVSLPEGSGPANRAAPVAISLSASLATMECVWYHTVDGTATGVANGKVHDAAHDYVRATSKVVKIPAGKTAVPISTTVVYDTAVEGDETFNFVVDKVTAAVGTTCPAAATQDPAVEIVKGTGTVTMMNDDVPFVPFVSSYTDPSIIGPYAIAAGPDGNMWFSNEANSIAKITPAGVVTNYTHPSIGLAQEITEGPDGNIWFTQFSPNTIGKITPAGVVTTYSISQPRDIATGPDGNLWFTRGGNLIGKITPAGVVTNYPAPGISDPTSIALGPDGNLWFTNYDSGNSSIGKITPAGVVTIYTDPSIIQPWGIAAGPDGNLWFTKDGNSSIGKITPAGSVSSFPIPIAGFPQRGIAAGPDGNVWFTNNGNSSIGKITPAGVVTNYTDPSISQPRGIAAGPDGNLWFANNASGSGYSLSSIGKIALSSSQKALRVGDVSLPEGSGPTNRAAALAVSLTGPLATTECVWYHTVDGTATGAANGNVHDATHDYLRATSKVVKIPAGKTVATISTTVLYDTAEEADETYTVMIDKVTAAVGTICPAAATQDPAVQIVNGTRTVTILDDDVGI